MVSRRRRGKSSGEDLVGAKQSLLTPHSSRGFRIGGEAIPASRIPIESRALGMRRYAIWPEIVPYFMVVALSAGCAARGQAAEAGNSFVVVAADGYGVEDCLAEGEECGRVVADAWCEAHGHGPAISFGLADDVTGAITTKVAAEKPRNPYIIRCGN
jgi:hypothetical protein